MGIELLARCQELEVQNEMQALYIETFSDGGLEKHCLKLEAQKEEMKVELREALESCITLCRTKFGYDSCENNGNKYDCKMYNELLHCSRHKQLAKLEEG